MEEDRHQTSRLHIRALPVEYDAFLVEVGGAEAGGVPVIPTAQAMQYWIHATAGEYCPAW
jgi:hypothetical protein